MVIIAVVAALAVSWFVSVSLNHVRSNLSIDVGVKLIYNNKQQIKTT